ncbi:hypothetical protein B0O99DRAFT_147714 [Bisporella sp. PMI_857]|nr:hypothetical protein B0O99DRAFT_147714 [Bisporella sp. PMI_857]
MKTVMRVRWTRSQVRNIGKKTSLQMHGWLDTLVGPLSCIRSSSWSSHVEARHSNRTHSLLHLPSEIRNRIYKHYFDRDEEVKRPEEGYAPFRDREGKEVQRIRLSSENVKLKFWLSTALLQALRQLRLESMSILFRNSVITVECLPVLSRFVDFQGKEGW